ncbi:MAG TPA: serine/threonine-protein kinase [Thermoanaerobaculia bacterium]|nr:serine/threonine-protein kinase [Thermoanaerobaculia bacterium]
MSSPARHERAGELLVEALQRPPEERGSFLEMACGQDLAMRREVETLLRSHEEAGNFLEVPVLQAARWDTDAAWQGRRVGPYRLVREIGRGGMGVVYVAERADRAFEKKVAVKLIKQGMDTEQVIHRFEKERRILAALDHPHIARILDGGTTEDGLPYFVMEYVDGLPILDFCDSRRLSTTQRLRLFSSVCAAVAFAHQNLVIHRDLKPGNILVDAAGEPWLLDFGIAKLLGDEDLTTRTLTGLRPMTPRYSSPEQIRGEPINTASDVYSLGVVLYELLTGRAPYRLAGRSPSEVERAVCEEEPDRPSAAIGRRPDGFSHEERPGAVTPQAVSATREGDPKRLRRRLSGDLDTILLRALRKDPRRRYASVEQLAEDIRRHLAGLPIRAHRDTLIYRGSKFVRRHFVGVAAAALVAVLALGAAVSLGVQRARIERERLKAEQVSAFLTSLFKASDPRDARGANLTVREMLDRGASRIRRDLAGQPEVQATLMDTIGDVYRELGSYEQAQAMIEGSYRIRVRLFGERDLRVAESLQSLGEVAMDTGRYPEAEKRFREALSLRRGALGEQNLSVAASQLALGRALHQRGMDRESEASLRNALSIRRKILGENDLAVANAWHVLAATLASLGEPQEAEQALRRAFEIALASSDPDNPSVTAYRNDLGIVLMAQGKFHEAAALDAESLESRRRLVGEEHPSIAPLLANLAAALDLDGKTEEAEGLSRRALAMARKTLGESHPNIGFAWNNLATILRRKGDVPGAESAAREALRIFRTNLPQGHVNISGPLINLGWALTAKGRPAEAEPLLREALQIRVNRLRSADWRIPEAQGLLGACLAAQGRFDEAAPLLNGSYEALRGSVGVSNRLTREALERLAVLQDRRGKTEKTGS